MDGALREVTLQLERFNRKRFARFLLVGGLNTLFGLTVFSTLSLLTLPPWACLIGSNIAGVTFNFFTTGGLVFLDTTMARLPRFASAYAFLYCLNLALIHLLEPLIGGAIMAQSLLAAPLAVLSFLLFQNWVYAGSPPSGEATRC